jgi:hypothetical protein
MEYLREHGRPKVYSPDTTSGFIAHSRLHPNLAIAEDPEESDLQRLAMDTKHKQDMSKHHDLKTMSLPFEVIKKTVAPFKQMVNFEPDYGTSSDP